MYLRSMLVLHLLISLTSVVKAQEWIGSPTVTTCTGPSNSKQKICFGNVKFDDGGKRMVICLGTASDQCPSAIDCLKEEKAKTEKKDWIKTTISGNNKANPSGGPSLPATKSCKLKPSSKIAPINGANKLVNIQCGDSPMYLLAMNEDKIKEEEVRKEISPGSLKIGGKPVDLTKFKAKNIPSTFYMIWTALSKQAADIVLPDGISSQKSQGELQILQELKDQGFEVKKANLDIDFTYTPPTKDHIDQHMTPELTP